MDTNKQLHEHISALADGELPDSERELALAALATPEGQAAWRAWQVAGDMLRSTPGIQLSDDFNARLATRLAAEAPYAPMPVPAPASAAADLEDQPAAIIFP